MQDELAENKNIDIAVGESVIESELVKGEAKKAILSADKPKMRYFDLLEDSSPSYILGYN